MSLEMAFKLHFFAKKDERVTTTTNKNYLATDKPQKTDTVIATTKFLASEKPPCPWIPSLRRSFLQTVTRQVCDLTFDFRSATAQHCDKP